MVLTNPCICFGKGKPSAARLKRQKLKYKPLSSSYFWTSLSLQMSYPPQGITDCLRCEPLFSWPLLYKALRHSNLLRNFVQTRITFALFRCKMSDILNMEISLQNPDWFFLWTDYMMSPRRKWHYVQYICSSPPYWVCLFYHVAQLPIGSLEYRIFNRNQYPNIQLPNYLKTHSPIILFILQVSRDLVITEN